MVACLFWMRSSPAPVPLPTPRQDNAEIQALDSIGSGRSSPLGHAPILRQLRTPMDIQKISSPPVGISLGGQSGEADAPDLSTPAMAVYEVLALIDRGATDQLSGCFVEGNQDTADSLYPQCLGHPIELVEVAQDGNTAKVFWNATVHIEVVFGAKTWSLGETIGLETHLIQVDGAWKLTRLHERSP